MIEIYTIGVYNSTEESYFDKLKNAGIDLFVDIRQRRGVRGAQYKYVNSNYLQAKLSEMGIDYLYVKELAPTNEIRQKQKDADKKRGETKKVRVKLGDVFVNEYEKCILNNFDMESLVNRLIEGKFEKVVFFCVEEKAEACHRSLVANAISKKYGFNVINL